VLRFAARLAAAGACSLIMILSFYGYQNWRSRRAWSAFQNELKQRGETFDVTAFLPALVTDSQNTLTRLSKLG
jgi:hypothetical protein